MRRRDFLAGSASLAGAMLPFFARGASTPCPPPTLGVGGGTSVSTACVNESGALTSLMLYGSGTNRAWTVGQAFARGDVPSGWHIAADEPEFQSIVRNRWSDGSVKFALLSGLSSVDGSKQILISRDSTTPGGTNVSEPTSLDVSVSFSGQVTGSYSLQQCLGVDRSTWNKTAAGRVRQLLGPIMSEFHYYCPTSDAHICLWFYVRRYANGATEVETVVENGWLGVAAPTQKDYAVTVKVAGTTRYSATISHFHHTRWSRVDWLDSDPAITAVQDTGYLRRTRLVPNYGNFGPVSDSAFAPYVQSATPMSNGNWRPNFGDTGESDTDQIGPLPPWEALYITTRDGRAFNALIANARMAGSAPTHFRDETTGRPIRFSQHPNDRIGDANVPAGSGGSAITPDTAHAPCMGYLPYLLTGRWQFMEESQLWSTYHYLARNPEYRNYADGLWWGDQVRAVAWGLRQLAVTTAITPDDDSAVLQSELRASFEANVAAMYTRTVPTNAAYYTPIGIVTPPRTDSDMYQGNGRLDAPGWQYDFLALVLGWSYDIDITQSPYLAPLRDHAYKFTIGRLGGSYCYRRVVSYEVAVSNVESGITSGADYYTDFANVYSGTAASQGWSPITCSDGDSLLDGSSPISAARWTLSYAGHAMAACVYAVDHGAPGADTAYGKLTGSSSWQLTSAFADAPKWAVVPR